MLNSKIIKLVVTIVICISSTLSFNSSVFADEYKFGTVQVVNNDNEEQMSVIVQDNTLFVPIDSVLKYSDYASNQTKTVLYNGSTSYHKVTIDYDKKTISLGEGNRVTKLKNVLNIDNTYYLPLGELCAWIGLNLKALDGKLYIDKDIYSLWGIVNSTDFSNYHFNYVQETGDSGKLLYLSYLYDTVLNIGSKLPGRVFYALSGQSSVADYETVLENAVIDSVHLADANGLAGDLVDVGQKSIVLANAGDYLTYFPQLGIGDNIPFFSTKIDLANDAVMGCINTSLANEDAREMVKSVYVFNTRDTAEKKAADAVSMKYNTEVYGQINSLLEKNLSSIISEFGSLASAPVSALTKASDFWGMVVTLTDKEFADTVSDIALVPALTDCINTSMQSLNSYLNNARGGDYSFYNSEHLRLSAILYLELCKQGYEIMLSPKLGASKHAKSMINDIDEVVTKLHFARSSSTNDSLNGIDERMEDNTALLKGVNVSYVNRPETMEPVVNEQIIGDGVLDKFNYLITSVYIPGDTHYANNQIWPHGGIQCYGFAREIFYQLFGKTFSDLDTNKYYVFREDQSDINNVSVVGQLLGSQINYDNVKNLLSNARVGDVIQMVNGANKLKHHTMIVGRSIYDDGLEIYENNWSPYLTELSKHTWRGICNYTGSYPASGITLYRASGYDSYAMSTLPESPQPQQTSIAFSGHNVVTNSGDPTDVTFRCEDIRADRIGDFTEWGLTVWDSAGNEIKTVNDTGTTWHETHITAWYGAKKYGINLQPGADYTYRFYAVFDGVAYYGDTQSYKVE